MLTVGLTGNIAAGKSAVASRLAARGATVVDADALARQAVAKGSPALATIIQRWGPEVLGPDGELDRAALRRIVFTDDRERAALNAIVHPDVARLRDRAVEAARKAGASLVVLDVPLLFELRLEDSVDVIVLVDAPVAVRRARLTAGRGLPPDEADAMIAAQMPSGPKRARADFILDNDGTLDALAAKTDELWAALIARADRA